MIKLENVSTSEFLQTAYEGARINEVYKYIYELLYVYDIDDYQKLKDLIASGSNDLDRASVLRALKEQLEMIERNVRNANLQGKEPKIFTFDIGLQSDIDKQTLEITDKANNGSVLLYANPLQRYGARVGKIKRASVSELKYLLSHVESYFFSNCFIKMRDMGVDTAKKVANAINFYEQQLLRQASETDERGVNLLAVNKELKDEIVESELKDIVEYILDNAEECVWGKLSDTQKKNMRSASISVKGCYIQKDRRNLIDTISNYTTLSELQQGVIKKKTLNRFIVR